VRLEIQGPGAADLGIAGNGNRILEVGPGATLDLSGVTLRSGYHDFGGGGLFNNGGALRVWNSVFSDNLSSGEGGALNNAGGTAVISDTLFVDNRSFHDGAIMNSGAMTVTGATFRDNSARVAGAVNNSGTLTVTQSAFLGNGARISGGGGMVNSGVLVVANSTFYANRSGFTGGGIHSPGGSLEITNSTFYSNTAPLGGNLAGGGTMRLRNTLLAAGNEGSNCEYVGTTLTADASNLATDTSCDAATVKGPAELALGALLEAAGPAPVIPLQFGSAAIDAGVDAVCAAPQGTPAYGAGGIDQRGVSRPVGAHCDVGAYEWNLTFWLNFPAIFSP
jgi:hypothetical protein